MVFTSRIAFMAGLPRTGLLTSARYVICYSMESRDVRFRNHLRLSFMIHYAHVEPGSGKNIGSNRHSSARTGRDARGF